MRVDPGPGHMGCAREVGTASNRRGQGGWPRALRQKEKKKKKEGQSRSLLRGDSKHSLARGLLTCPVDAIQIGKLPTAGVLASLGQPGIPGSSQGTPNPPEEVLNPFTAILPLLALPGAEQKESKSRVLIKKDLPTLPAKVVEKAQRLEFIEMEEFLPAPRSLRLTEWEKANPSLQESLVGGMNEFQATLYQKTQWKVQDILTWTRCFTLYLGVVAKVRAEMVPCMVAHLHTVFKLYRKVPQVLA